MLEMEQSESPMSSDSAHTPLQDEHIACEINTHIEIPVNIEIGENVDMIEEQLDYEEFVENNEETKAESEAEEGEYNSTDDNDVLICEVDEKKSLENGEIHSDNEEKFEITKNIQKMTLKKSVDNETVDVEIVNDDSKCEGELADGELKAEEEEIPLEETPWERGLRLARERRELAKLKKVQEKDKLKERQLHINLDNIEEVEPICKPEIEKNYEVNHKLLKAMQPIVILPEEPRHNEMILEYYLAESDYQHRPRFIPSRLYTLDPWEVDEWKRELDMMKMENEIERMASNKHKRALGMKPARRTGRRGSVSSSGSSRSSSVSDNKAPFNQSNRTYEFQTSQYALSRNKPAMIGKNEKPPLDDSINKLHMHRGRRDLPPEFKNRIVSSSRSSSRSSSGSHSSSSGSSSSSRSTSSPRASPKKRTAARGAAAIPKPPMASSNSQQQPPMFRTIKKPALGRARSDSSASSKSSDSSSTSSDSSSSRSSGDSSTNASRKMRKTAATAAAAAADSKQFINSWFSKTPQNPLLEATVVPEVSSLPASAVSGVAATTGDERAPAVAGVAVSTVAPVDSNECELPSASSRPGVKLKLLSRPKPVILPNHSSAKPQPPAKEKLPTKKTTGASVTSTTAASVTKSSVTAPSSIFNNSKSIFSTLSGSGGGSHHSHHHRSGESLAATAAAAKESAFKSNLAATQLEMQQEFLRNYKDKIAIYRSQLSYQQQQLQHHHPGGCTLAHAQPPPIKGPITVMSVTSKKTGPPKTQVKVTDRYSQHEEHSRRYNSHSNNNNNSSNHHNNNSSSNHHNNSSSGNHHHNSSSGNHQQQQHYSPTNYRSYDGPPSRNRNRSRSFDNDRGGRNYFDKAPQRDYGSFRSGRNSENNNSNNKDGGSSRYGEGRFRSGGGDKQQHDKFDRRSDFDRGNRFEGRGEDRSRREDRHYRTGRGDSFNRNRGGESDNNTRGEFTRNERPRERFRDTAAPNDYEERYSDSNNAPVAEKHQQHHHHREDYFETGGSTSGKSRARNPDRGDTVAESSTAAGNSSTAAVGNHHGDEATVQKPAAAVAASVQVPVAVVPKEKRREELLKQLKAVEDAIAKKKAKIDK